MAPAGLSNLGSGISIIWAIVFIVFGFLAIALPFATSWGVVLVIAWLIVFSGAFQFIHAFQSHGVGHIVWKLLVAILYLIVGIYFLLHPMLGVAAFTFALAIFFVVEGVFDLVAYFPAAQCRRLGLDSVRRHRYLAPRHAGLAPVALQLVVGDRYAGGHQHDHDRNHAPDDEPGRQASGAQLEHFQPFG